MFASALLALALVQPAEPQVRLSLNSDASYRPGERARVHVRAAEDGYLVVLRTDVDGWVRVLYPVEPFEDAFVRGGRELEVRDRGNREAFAVSRREGSGVVLAAWSPKPFEFRDFIRNDHWDYRILDSARSSDDEAALLAIAERMAPGGDIGYDVLAYTVGDGGSGSRSYATSSSYYGYYPSYYPGCWSCDRGIGWSVGFSFGNRPWYRSSFYWGPVFYSSYDPWYYSCWGCYSRSYYSYGYSRPWGTNAWGWSQPWYRGGYGSRGWYDRGGRSYAYGFRESDRYVGEPRRAIPRNATVGTRTYARAASEQPGRGSVSPDVRDVRARRGNDESSVAPRSASPRTTRNNDQVAPARRTEDASPDRSSSGGSREVSRPRPSRASEPSAEPRRSAAREPSRGESRPSSTSRGSSGGGSSGRSAQPSSGGGSRSSGGSSPSSGGGRRR